MNYTARFAHLAAAPMLRSGQIISRGQKIGRMGNTGKSTGAHLHLDVVEGVQAGHYRLADMVASRPIPSAHQASLFIDDDLFKTPCTVTTYYYDPRYRNLFGVWHPAYDVVPINSAFDEIYWNRSMDGRVTRVFFDPAGYGHCIQISFETK